MLQLLVIVHKPAPLNAALPFNRCSVFLDRYCEPRYIYPNEVIRLCILQACLNIIVCEIMSQDHASSINPPNGPKFEALLQWVDKYLNLLVPTNCQSNCAHGELFGSRLSRNGCHWTTRMFQASVGERIFLQYKYDFTQY
jgi:hypothetical protein